MQGMRAKETDATVRDALVTWNMEHVNQQCAKPMWKSRKDHVEAFLKKVKEA